MRRTVLNASSLPAISLLLLLVSVCAAQAQSGRRLPKGSPPQPQPTPAEPEQAPARPAQPAQPQVHLLVISDTSMSLSFSYGYPERVQSWVVQRLRESRALEVAVGERGNRGQASKRAKASTEGFVIFIEVDENSFSPSMSRTGRSSVEDIRISYTVFSPVTGKSKSSGVVYAGQTGSIIGIGRGRSLPICYPGARGNEYMLLQASLEVAERVMSSLGVASPPLCSRL